MERLVAAVAAMSAVVYLIAAGVAWQRVVRPPPNDSLVKRVMLDRAVAWTGLFVLFSLIAGVKMHQVAWTDRFVDSVVLVALLAVYFSGLVSVRAITSGRHGNRVVIVFAAASLGVGLLVLLL